jgi:hypothetical protein
MATDRDQWADNLSGESSGGWLAGFLADEDQLDRRSLWRLGSWGAGSVAAVVVALLANQYSIGWRREQGASADLARQAQQIQWIAKESQDETRRLASAVDTLNSDRDRLYSRVTVLEQGLDTVTGSIGRQSAASASEAPTSTPAVSPPFASSSAASVPSTPQPAADPPAAELIGPPKPAAVPVPTVSKSGAPPAGSPSPSVAQNIAPPPATAAPKTTAAATAAATDKASTAAALPPGPAAAPAPPQTAVPVARSELTNDASAAAITAPATAMGAPATAMAAPTTAMAAPMATATAAPAVSTTPLMPSKSILAPPDPAAAKLIEPDPSTSNLPPLPSPQTVAAAPGMTEPAAAEAQVPAVAVQRTEFGIDLGGANSVDGLRALWRGLLKFRSNKALAELRPIIVVRERSSGLGMQLRLVAGPLSDAAAAAKICATLTESDRSCETTVFDGQRLALKNDNGVKSDASTKAEGGAPAAAAVSNGHPAAASGRSLRRRGSANGTGTKAEEPEKPPPTKSSLTSFLGLR